MKGYPMVWYILGTFLAWKAVQKDRSRRFGMNLFGKEITGLTQQENSSDTLLIHSNSMRTMEKTAKAIANLNRYYTNKVDLSHLLLEVEARKN